MKISGGTLVLFLIIIFYQSHYAQAHGAVEKRIIITYSHSLRIRHKEIFIEIKNHAQNPDVFEMQIETKAMAYTEPDLNLEDKKTREYIESAEYKKQKLRRINSKLTFNISILLLKNYIY